MRHFLDASEYVTLYNQAVKSDAQYDIASYGSLEEAIKAYKRYYGIYGLTLNQLANGTDFKNHKVNTDWQSLLYNDNAPSNQINLSATGGDDKTRFFVSGFYNIHDAIVINNKFYRYGGRLNLEHNPTEKLSIGINISVDRSQLNRVQQIMLFLRRVSW